MQTGRHRQAEGIAPPRSQQQGDWEQGKKRKKGPVPEISRPRRSQRRPPACAGTLRPALGPVGPGLRAHGRRLERPCKVPVVAVFAYPPARRVLGCTKTRPPRSNINAPSRPRPPALSSPIPPSAPVVDSIVVVPSIFAEHFCCLHTPPEADRSSFPFFFRAPSC